MHDRVVRDLEQARNRTLGLTDLDDPALVTQHDPLMSPLVWDLAHVGQQEELRLLRAGDPTRPGPGYSRQRWTRSTTRSAPPRRAPVAATAAPGPGTGLRPRGSRAGLLDLIEHTPAGGLFTAGMVVQHEEQHDETMLATLQLRQGPPVLLGRRALPPGRDAGPDRVSWAEGRSRLASTRPASRSPSATKIFTGVDRVGVEAVA
jgi:iron(II)-dependent oxidoreductase